MKKLLPIQVEIRSHSSDEKSALYSRFFKTAPGQYGEGDAFLGLTVPQTRSFVKKHITNMTLPNVTTLLESPYHEERLAGALSLVHFAKHHTYSTQELGEFYVKHTFGINNWDLIDVSSPHIIGPYLHDVLSPAEKDEFIHSHITSPNIWKVRIVLLASFYYIQQGDATLTVNLVKQTFTNRNDLIQKAGGWMLREVGKRVDRSILVDFLKHHAHEMPRTMLRYSIEHLGPSERAHYMAAARSSRVAQ